MILNWRCAETRRIFAATVSRKFPPDIQRIARRKLLQMHAATELGQLRVPPGNRLESLKRRPQKGCTASGSTTNGGFVSDGCRATARKSKSWITTDHSFFMKRSKLLENVTPGEILLEDFLKPMGITQYRLAKEIGVPIRRVTEIVQAKRGITADTALRLGRFFNMAPEFWLNLQSHYDLEKEAKALAGRLQKEVRPWRKLAA
jgi:addiction module HigA family antidote